MSADFRARLEGGMDSDRARGLTRTPSWGALPAQRAVSSALESAFRHELEGLLVRRGRQPAAMYASRGDAGAAAVDLVDRVDNALDALSGGDARRVEQGVAALREEVAALKHAIDAGFDIQLDIQRAVRQEVAAAMHAQSRPPVTAETSACTAGETSLPDVSALVAPRRHQRVVDGGACVICLDKPVDSLLYACGHMCTCAQCGRQLIANGEACPVCRAPIRDVVVAYMAR